MGGCEAAVWLQGVCAARFFAIRRILTPSRFLASFGALIMMSGLFTSTLTQQAITYDVLEAKSSRSNDTATVDRATVFSTYDGDKLAISKPPSSSHAHAAN